MRFSVDRDRLHATAEWVCQAVPERPLLPILAGIRIDSGEAQARLSAFDYNLSASASVPLLNSLPGSMILPGKLFLNMVKTLPAGTVEIELRGSQATIASGQACFDIVTMPVEDYPALPALPELCGTLSAEDLKAGLDRVSYAVGDAEDVQGVRIDMVRMEGGEKSVFLVTTDRFRIPITEIPWTRAPGVGDVAVNLPPKVLAAFIKAATGETKIHLPSDHSDGREGVLGLVCQERTMITTLASGGFPKWRRSVPDMPDRDWQMIADVDTAEFMGALERAQVVLKPGRAAWLTFTDYSIQVTSGEDSTLTETVDAEVHGDPLTVTYNPAYIIAALKAAPSPRVRLHMREGKTGLVRALDSDIPYGHVLVPLRVA